MAWRHEHKCVSCHHAGLVVWSMRKAKRARARGRRAASGRADKVDCRIRRWQNGDSQARGRSRTLNEKAVSLALGLAADPHPDAISLAGTKTLLTAVKEDQVESGASVSSPQTRQPIFGNSDERTTASAILALLPAASAGDGAAKSAGTRAHGGWSIRRLMATRNRSPCALWSGNDWAGRRANRSRDLINRAAQNADGGWSQTTEMASDAWATGQALYALAHAGLTRRTDRRARSGVSGQDAAGKMDAGP